VTDDEIATAMAADAAPAQHRELFVSAVLLLQARQRRQVTREAWERLWNAADALLERRAAG
jgi:hypothetical protein